MLLIDTAEIFFYDSKYFFLGTQGNLQIRMGLSGQISIEQVGSRPGSPRFPIGTETGVPFPVDV